MPRKSAVGRVASEKTRAQFADELASLTTFSEEELANLFPTETDRKELKSLLDAVNAATDDNVRKQRIIDNIQQFSGAVVKLTQKISTGGLV